MGPRIDNGFKKIFWKKILGYEWKEDVKSRKMVVGF